MNDQILNSIANSLQSIATLLTGCPETFHADLRAQNSLLDQHNQLLASQNKLLEDQNALLKRIADAVAPDTESALSIAKHTADELSSI